MTAMLHFPDFGRKAPDMPDILITRNTRNETALVQASREKATRWLGGYFIAVLDNAVTVSLDALPEIEIAAREAGLTVEIR